MTAIILKGQRQADRVLAVLGEPHLRKLGQRAVRAAFFEYGKDLRQEASREILRKPKSGRVYFVRGRTGRRRRHVASAPGETHANLRGRLRRSLSWKVFGSESMAFGYGVSTPVGANSAPKYAPFVEFGTRNMDERPSLANAIDATQRKIPQHFERAVTRELERGRR